jgi:hypothetical protein
MHVFKIHSLVIIAACASWLTVSAYAGENGTASAENTRHPAQQVQLAIPFGVAAGQLVVSGQNLMFIDQQNAADSFAVARDDVRSINAQGAQMTVLLDRPLQDPGGQTSRLIFRLQHPAGAGEFTQWFYATSSDVGQANRTANSAAPLNPATLSFQVKHDHLIGSDSGRLMITPHRVIYESVTDVNDSRQWNMSNIKDITRNGPYQLKVVPFSGHPYNFDLLGGKGLSSNEYHALVNRVTSARISRG